MARKPREYTPIIHAPAPAVPTSAELLADGVVDVKTAANLCGHGRKWIRQQIEANAFPSFLMERKRVIPRRALLLFLAARMEAAAG